MPYRLYSIRNTNIEYSYKAGIVEFKLNKIFRLDNNKSTGQAIYTLFISNNTESITKMTKCSLGNVYKVIQTFQGETVSGSDSRKSVVFSLKVYLLLFSLKKLDKRLETQRLISWERRPPSLGSKQTIIMPNKYNLFTIYLNYCLITLQNSNNFQKE